MGCGASAAKSDVAAVYPCQRCGKISPNGPPNQYCSIECKEDLLAASSGSNPSVAVHSAPRTSGGGGAICQRPGCGKPTFDGNPGFCSRTCRSGGSTGGALCARPGCGKPSWNGDPGEFCGRTCQAQGSGGGGGALCMAGCGKPTWNGLPNEYCSRSCREKAADPNAANVDPADPCAPGGGQPLCMNPGCGKPTWNGLPNEFCSNYCRSTASHPSMCKLLSPGNQRYEEVKNQYEAKWDSGRGSPTPIRAIYEVVPSTSLDNDFNTTIKSIGNVPTFGNGTNPGNVQRRFHGTRLKCAFNGVCCGDTECSACSIVTSGFDMSRLGKWSGNKGHYGGGIYFTSMSSTAKGYGTKSGYSWSSGNWSDPNAGNAILVVKVACGRVETVKDKTNDPVDFSSYDSRKIDKDTGVDELVVFKREQAMPRFLICF